MINPRIDFTKPMRYVTYARYSSDTQNPASISQQRATIAAVVKRLGHPWVHVADYDDEAISGRLMRKRPGFQKMLDDIKSGRNQVDLILVDTLERFGRMEELPTIRRHLRTRYGVLVLTADTGMADPTGPAGEALSRLEADRSTSHAHVLGHNVKRGRLDAARRKQWPGGTPPVGYRLESVMKPGSGPAEVSHRILVPDPVGASAVKRVFELAREHGWGSGRLARYLNDDAESVAKFGTFGTSRVGYVLTNPIYIGTLRFNAKSTDIIDDCHVTRKNDPEEVILIEEFCEPIIPRELWDGVKALRDVRSAKIRAMRAAKAKPDEKQLRPTAPGIVLKYPLTGLVRCASCGAAMRASRSGENYYYYHCQIRREGRCDNDRIVRGDWLFEVVVARLRERLFPLGSGDAPPTWIAELIAEVRAELTRMAESRQSDRPLLQRELQDVNSRIAGWSQTLAKPDLAATVRQHVEREFEAALQRAQRIETTLAGLEDEVKANAELLDPQIVVERLTRLTDVLGSGNPTELNMELAAHIEQILVYRDGHINMRSSRLGVFEGVAELLAVSRNRSADESDAASKSTTRPPPTLWTRQASTLGETDPRSVGRAPSGVPGVRLPEKWVHVDVFITPGFYCKAEKIAAEAQRLRQSDPSRWTHARLAEHLNVTLPTIRRALRIASAWAKTRPADAPALSTASKNDE